MTECPKCGGEIYDNRQKKANGAMKPNAPDFKCKDKEGCGWVKWPPKGQQQNHQGTKGNGAGPKWTWGALSQLYGNCLKLAVKHVGTLLPEANSADTIAAAATLFIAASRDGVKPILPKPEPEPEPVHAAEEDADNDDDLPF